MQVLGCPREEGGWEKARQAGQGLAVAVIFILFSSSSFPLFLSRVQPSRAGPPFHWPDYPGCCPPKKAIPAARKRKQKTGVWAAGVEGQFVRGRRMAFPQTCIPPRRRVRVCAAFLPSALSLFAVHRAGTFTCTCAEYGIWDNAEPTFCFCCLGRLACAQQRHRPARPIVFALFGHECAIAICSALAGKDTRGLARAALAS